MRIKDLKKVLSYNILVDFTVLTDDVYQDYIHNKSLLRISIRDIPKKYDNYDIIRMYRINPIVINTVERD